jgi:hypothetical protein
MLRMENVSMALDAGHIITPRWHKCGGFEDTYPWTKIEVLTARLRVSKKPTNNQKGKTNGIICRNKIYRSPSIIQKWGGRI